MSDRTSRIRWVIGSALLPVLLIGGVEAVRVESAIAQTTQDRKAEAEKLLDLGEQQVSRTEYKAALENFQKALVLFRQVGDRVREGDALHGLGVIHFNLNQYLEALDSYNQALVIRQELRNREGEGRTLNNIGLTYDDLMQDAKALEFFNRGLAILREIGDSEGESTALGNIGRFYHRLGQYSKALSFYNKALVKYRESGNRRGEGRTLSKIGSTYYSQSRYSEALDSYNQALVKHRESDDREGEARTLSGIGLVHSDLGQDLEALKFFEQGLGISRSIGDRRGEAGALNNIGGVYNYLRRLPEAMRFYNLSLVIHREIKDHRGEGRLLNNIGSILSDYKLYPLALEHFNQALGIQIEIGDREGEYKSLGQIGGTHFFLKQYPEALDFFNRSLIITKEIDDRAGEGITLSNIGYVLDVQKQSELAITFLKQSVSIHESIRENIRRLPVEQQKAYTEKIAGVYRGLADILLKQDRVLEAQQVLDLLKVQELESYLRNVRGNTAQFTILRPEESILKQYGELQKSAIQIGQELAQLRSKASKGSLSSAEEKRLADLDKLETALNQEFSSFQDRPEIRKLISQLTRTAQEQSIQLQDLDAVRDDLRRLNAVMLYPLILDDRLELIITTPNAPPLRRTVPVKRSELNATILEFRRALQDPTIDPKPIAQKLYTWLIKPLEADLKATNPQSIIYAPDGQLRYIPLAALHDGTQWLAQRYQVNNITAKSLTKFNDLSKPDLTILAGAFSDPKTTFPIQVGDRKIPYQGPTFAGGEVATLRQRFPNTALYLDRAFSLAALKPRMNGFSIVHLATHAAFVPGDPKQSFILFGDGSIATLRDIENWSLSNVDLMVLSACETGVGIQAMGEKALGNGEEILGLGYQFQNRGVRATIASLWSVDDGGTQALMNAFYTALQSGKYTKAQALQQAQIALITQPKEQLAALKRGLAAVPDTTTPQLKRTLDHPYYWSPFVLIGSGF